MNWLTARSNDVLYIFVCQFRILSCVLAVAEVGRSHPRSVYILSFERERINEDGYSLLRNVRIKFTEFDNTVQYKPEAEFMYVCVHDWNKTMSFFYI